MKSNNRLILGVLLVIFGVVFLLDRLDIIPINIFFDGWWTLLLIIPALISMSKQGVSVGNAIVLTIGLYFFIDERGWNFKGLFMPAILILFGLYFILRKR